MKILRPKFLLLLCILSMFTMVCIADDPGPDPGGDPDAPIDGGISLLVAAGVLYGAKKIHDSKNKNISEI